MTSCDLERSSRDPNTLRAQYLENSWRCYLAARSQAVARIGDRTASQSQQSRLSSRLIRLVIDTKKHLQLFSRYCALSVLGSGVWCFRVTWRHRSCDHLIFRGHFLLMVFCNQTSISNGFQNSQWLIWRNGWHMVNKWPWPLFRCRSNLIRHLNKVKVIYIPIEFLYATRLSIVTFALGRTV